MSQYDDSIEAKNGSILHAKLKDYQRETNRIWDKVQPFVETSAPVMVELETVIKPGQVIRRRRVYATCDEQIANAKHYWSLTKFRSNSLMYEYKRVQTLQQQPNGHKFDKVNK